MQISCYQLRDGEERGFFHLLPHSGISVENWEQVKAAKSLQSFLGWKNDFTSPSLYSSWGLSKESTKYSLPHAGSHPHQGFYTLCHHSSDYSTGCWEITEFGSNLLWVKPSWDVTEAKWLLRNTHVEHREFLWASVRAGLCSQGHKPVPSLPLQANILSDARLVRKNHLKAGVWQCRPHPARPVKKKRKFPKNTWK